MSVKPPGLTQRERDFVTHVVVLNDQAEAARRAGFSPRSAKQRGCEVAKRPHVAAAIAAGRAEVEAQVQAAHAQTIEAAAQMAATEAISREYVLGTMREVVERCMQRAPVMVRRGKETVQATDEDDRHVWTFDAKGANGALRMLGEHLGVFKMPTLPPGAAMGVVLLPAIGEPAP